MLDSVDLTDRLSEQDKWGIADSALSPRKASTDVVTTKGLRDDPGAHLRLVGWTQRPISEADAPRYVVLFGAFGVTGLPKPVAVTTRLSTLAPVSEALRAEARMGGLCAIHGCGPLAAMEPDPCHTLSAACPVVTTIPLPD